MNVKRESLSVVIFCSLLFCLGGTAHAVSMPDLYTAEVAFDTQRRDGRQRAYSDALATVLSRLTPAVADARRVEAFAKPGQFVLGYRETGDQRMWVSLDGIAISAELRGAGLPVWGSDRPLTLVWMALERNTGERELVGAASAPGDTQANDVLVALRRDLMSSASAYGVPLRFPVLDDRDRAAVQDSDIWGGFSEVIVEASRRYRADSVLIGRVREAAPDDIRWSWAFAGESERFRGELPVAVRRVSQRLLEQFASSPGGSLSVKVHVVGIDGMDGFARISRLLNTQSLIQRIDVVAVRADAIVFDIDSLTTRTRLAELLSGNSLEQIEPLESTIPSADPFSSADLHFRVRSGAAPRL
ncbi:MAG: DUF2066 domain-containing protein [Pseudomonadota bacterium]